jgi:signal transduction histidine kinase
MSALEEDSRLLPSQEPALVCNLEDHPVYQQHAEAGLKPFLMPDWSETQEQMIVIPVMRASSFYGLISLAHDGESARAIQADLKFLAITASQLAINLENLALLEETQQAYSRLKALQDETIELEKMATRGAMSAEIGHELNNFLGVVVGNVDLLKIHIEKQNYDRLGKYLDTVSGTLAQITSFTDNLMDMSSISSQVEVIRFDKLLTEVVEYLEPQRRFDGIEIKVPVHLEPTFLEADTTQIQQLLYNLFHNAADAISGRTERRIDVSLETNFDTNSFEIAIRDTGAGMSSESLAKAFQEKFTTKKTGHGFGLVVCKRIIDKHNGELQIESTLGEGTCITITFPLAQLTAAEQSVTPPEQPIPIG